MYQLQIVAHDDENDLHVIATKESERQLERAEQGANINLDHERYFTRIIEVDA